VLEGEALAHWLTERCGKLTASNMPRACSFKKNGDPAAERTDLIREILAERLTGSTVRHYVNPAMLWGLEQEQAAKDWYEMFTGNFISPCGFYDHPTIDMFGATPDGLVDDGLLEVKCPTTTTFIKWKMAGGIPEEHHAQMLAQLACTGRRWVDFVAFDPRVKGVPGFVRRFTPEPGKIADVEASAIMFLEEVDKAWEVLTAA
jgi:predicted phage-related endonuclease